MALSCLSNQRHVSVEFKISTPAMGTEQCKLGTSDDGAELRVQILKSFLQGHICEFFFEKGLKNKKKSAFGLGLPANLEKDLGGWL